MSQAKKLFSCQCTRCDGSGKHDRGTCFDCKGLGVVQRLTTRGMHDFALTVTYSNGSTNKPRLFATSRAKAISIIERQLRINGWTGVVA
ncbi:hypothetical protein [Burkholderia sp. Bp8990]|uniref:hypothetical protein n=1 Tax=Burkholderia sp. Bp8990 TaxID=2184552 RepID=UPI000F5903C0|nr:hypothetical protein [Burkholderia sp. Bp8990]